MWPEIGMVRSGGEKGGGVSQVCCASLGGRSGLQFCGLFLSYSLLGTQRLMHYEQTVRPQKVQMAGYVKDYMHQS